MSLENTFLIVIIFISIMYLFKCSMNKRSKHCRNKCCNKCSGSKCDGKCCNKCCSMNKCNKCSGSKCCGKCSGSKCDGKCCSKCCSGEHYGNTYHKINMIDLIDDYKLSSRPITNAISSNDAIGLESTDDSDSDSDSDSTNDYKLSSMLDITKLYPNYRPNTDFFPTKHGFCVW